jgi:hypothetical protein
MMKCRQTGTRAHEWRKAGRQEGPKPTNCLAATDDYNDGDDDDDELFNYTITHFKSYYEMTRKEFSNVGSPLVLFLSCMLIYS